MKGLPLSHIQPSGASLASLNQAIEGQMAPGSAKNSVSDLLQVMEKVQHRTGIVASHLAPLQSVAKEHNCIIGIRPVETVATGLIEEGHPTKDFHIKGKSANWGPQAGMICVDQAFSKLEGCLASDPGRIDKFNGQTRQCIEEGHAVAIPLVISRERMGTLLAADLITDMQAADAEGCIRFSAKAPGGGLYTFAAVPGAVEGLYQISQQGQPLEVLAKAPGGKALTADYDLHLIGPHISDLGPQDNLPVPDVAHDVFKARIDGYSARTADSRPRNLAQELRQDYASAGSFYSKEDPDIGNATSRIAEMIPVINTALVGVGERVVHHNADSGSPASDNASNYPATFFLPARLGAFDEICVIENSRQMAELILQAKNSGYHIPMNPLWEPEVTSVRRADFTQAQALLDRV
ncbi:anthrax toxin-like adenylyl cyclase domain-containing protein [Pseudomonas chlororaphis]|uniref:anthrax toxin-like adenylyl cyclase domain-containing protein n=1 Tax=Pseudomonas chlororaphis TaxID=587753 RepID=UPI000BE3C2B1|nr:anthrax toxin-like adenylyl cyclase domain-containing protein [Pseudomonas chlororaphis]